MDLLKRLLKRPLRAFLLSLRESLEEQNRDVCPERPHVQRSKFGLFAGEAEVILLVSAVLVYVCIGSAWSFGRWHLHLFVVAS